jgi:hypothetical protein
MAVPSIIEDTEFEAVQMLLEAHSPAPSAPHVVSGPASVSTDTLNPVWRVHYSRTRTNIH